MGERAIGIFDSGVGGLTVLKKITALMPNENIIYFADTLHVPYGNKSPSEILSYARNIIKFLIKCDVKIIVIACNTVCATCFGELKKEFKIDLINVLHSGVESALLRTKNKSVGIIATEATIKSRSYEKNILKKDNSIKIFSEAGPLLVKLAEEGDFASRKAFDTVEFYLKKFDSTGIDTLILGCTHFPLFYDSIKKILPYVNLVDPADETAFKVREYLCTKKMLRDENNLDAVFFVSDDVEKFRQLCEKILDINFDSGKFYNMVL